MPLLHSQRDASQHYGIHGRGPAIGIGERETDYPKRHCDKRVWGGN